MKYEDKTTKDKKRRRGFQEGEEDGKHTAPIRTRWLGGEGNSNTVVRVLIQNFIVANWASDTDPEPSIN